MKKLCWFFLLCFSTPAFSAEPLSGFDGIKWGSPVKSLKKYDDKTEAKSAKATVYRVFGDPEKPVFTSTHYEKQYVFCGEYGLCAGAIKIDTSIGYSALAHEAVLEAAQKMVAEKYYNYDSKGLGYIQGGNIEFFETKEPYKYGTLTELIIKYNSDEFLKLRSQKDQDKAKKLIKNKAQGNFGL